MNVAKTVLAAALVCWGGASAGAQDYVLEEDFVMLSPARHERRLAARRKVESNPFSRFGASYTDLKKDLSDRLGLSFGLDVSYAAQRVSPGGKQTSVLGVYYPYLSWNLFQDKGFGSGQLNVSYGLSQYWAQEGAVLQNRAGLAAAFNDSSSPSHTFYQFSYTHTLPGAWDWLSVTAGQFPLSNFDGTEYLDNQQTSLMNFALSQNASSAYPSASLGAYAQIQGRVFSAAAGYQDASNISGQDIRFSSAFSGAYTAFASASWTPRFSFGAGQYSFLYYYQPSVSSQPQYVNGWSVNAQQNLGEKWAVFARANGASGGATAVKTSYAAGAAYLDPFDRNPQDALIVGAAYNRLSEEGLGDPAYMRSGEAAFEIQYVFGIGKFITVTPDVQFYPRAGLDPGRGITTVAGIRTAIML